MIPTEYADNIELLLQIIKEDEHRLKSLREEKRTKEAELSKAEKELRMKRRKIQMIKDEIRQHKHSSCNSDHEQLPTLPTNMGSMVYEEDIHTCMHLNDQLTQTEKEVSTAKRRVKMKQREVERVEEKIQQRKDELNTHTKRLQTMQSNSSKVQEPVQVSKRNVAYNRDSPASSVHSLGQANATSQHSLQERSLVLNAEKPEHVS